MGFGDSAFSLNASLLFKGRLGFISNMSATDGGVNSKLSVFVAPYPGSSRQGVARHFRGKVSAAASRKTDLQVSAQRLLSFRLAPVKG